VRIKVLFLQRVKEIAKQEQRTIPTIIERAIDLYQSVRADR